jgi:hypothetical protein
MMLENRKRPAGPVLQLRIVAALGVALKQRNRILMGADKASGFASFSLSTLFCDELSSALGIAALASAGAIALSSSVVYFQGTRLFQAINEHHLGIRKSKSAFERMVE